MMKLLIVAHAPLASALRDVAMHAYADCGASIEALDVPADWDAAKVAARARALVDRPPGCEVLVLVDIFGATPGNGAAQLADMPGVRVVFGVNVPMVLRSVCYGLDAPLDTLADRALEGAVRGIMPIASKRPQAQTQRPPANAQADPYDQQ